MRLFGDGLSVEVQVSSLREDFCGALGQRVSVAKMLLFCGMSLGWACSLMKLGAFSHIACGVDTFPVASPLCSTRSRWTRRGQIECLYVEDKISRDSLLAECLCN